MSKTIEVAVYIPDADAAKWLLFQQHYDVFTVLTEKEVFSQRNATILLDFNHEGVLQSIRRNDFMYSRKHDTLSP